jgi:hypothetical protein
MEEDDFVDQNAHVQRINAARDEFKGMALNQMIFAMNDLRQEKDRLEEQLKGINARYDVLRHELIPATMEENGVASPYNVTGLGRITLTADLRVRVVQKTGLFDWLRDNRLGDLIQETVNAATLKASLKKRIIEGKEIPDSVECQAFTRASLTKAKA